MYITRKVNKFLLNTVGRAADEPMLDHLGRSPNDA